MPPITAYRKIVILGAAESGVGAALLAKKLGCEVFVSEKNAIDAEYKTELKHNGINFEEGGHSSKVFDAEIIIKSPGIPDKVDVVKQIKERNIPILSEIEYGYLNTDSKIVAVTGTNGKSTTASLIYHIANKAGLDVSLVGNIGKSFARQIAEHDTKYYVIEVSSFQLDNSYEFKPYISVLTNISNNHLDRYDGFIERYAASKFRLIQNQTASEYFIYNKDDEGTMRYMPSEIRVHQLPFTFHGPLEEGAFVENNQIIYKLKNTQNHMNLFDLALQGKHNVYNSMAAGVAAQVLEISKENVRESLHDFKSLEHRLEFVATVNDITFINDSKATNVNSVWYALESMTKPVIWIAGGIDKGNDYSFIKDIVKQKVKAIVCLGKDNNRIHEAFNRTVDLIVNTQSMADAVNSAFHFAAPGDVVLLSPGCASFDLFSDFEDRGRQFKEQVKAM